MQSRDTQSYVRRTTGLCLPDPDRTPRISEESLIPVRQFQRCRTSDAPDESVDLGNCVDNVDMLRGDPIDQVLAPVTSARMCARPLLIISGSATTSSSR
jgi:hypothetical protein